MGPRTPDAECHVSMVPVTPSPVRACAGKAGREWKIDWSPRGYSPLRLPAGTIVTFKYRPGAGATLVLRLCSLLHAAAVYTSALGCAQSLQFNHNISSGSTHAVTPCRHRVWVRQMLLQGHL